jgi:REP element-mobilizing transposase RayT
VFDKEVEAELVSICRGIEERYEVNFLEIGSDKDHIHMLAQSSPGYSVTKLVTIIKSITAREIFKRCPQVKRQLWGGEFWTSGYFVNTVSRNANEQVISNYIKNQGVNYTQLYSHKQLVLFS